MRRRPARALVALVVVVVALAAGTGRAVAKSFSITDVSTSATLRPDASMDVHERVTYDFSGGPFTVGIRSFEPRSRAQVVDFAVSENGVPLTVTPPSSSVSGEWEWAFASPATDARRTFDVTYRVVNAASVGPDVGELYWKFIGTDHPDIGAVSVDIALPGSFPVATPTTPDSDTSVVRAFAHGPANGRVDVQSDRVTLAVRDVPAEEFVEARIVVPAAAFTVPPTGGPRLPTILAEERSYQHEQDRKATLERVGNVLAPVLTVLGVLAFVVIWWIWGKEPRPPDTVGDYWREPLDDPPAVAIATLKFGDVPGAAFSSTVVDLAQRGYLTISEEHEERVGPDKTTYRFRWVGRGKDPLTPYEQSLLDHLFRGAPEATSESFAAWGKANPGTAQEFWRDWRKAVSADVEARGYLETGRVAPYFALAVIVLGLGLAGFGVLALGSPLFFLPWAAAVVLLVLGRLLRRRTPRGAEHAAEAEALKRYLHDFSTLDEAPVESLVIWERFLVYAVALGVAADLMRGLALKVPQVAQNTAFAAWYIGAQGRGVAGLGSLDRFGSSFGASATAALSPSSTGSGGGFSGGGGGGGGGGGFGAR